MPEEGDISFEKIIHVSCKTYLSDTVLSQNKTNSGEGLVFV